MVLGINNYTWMFTFQYIRKHMVRKYILGVKVSGVFGKS